nr:hypothetical protein [uncultured Dyadobacter sp.]
MKYDVKSPVWAMILLAICVTLRFCDPWLFDEEAVQTVGGGRSEKKRAWNVRVSDFPSSKINVPVDSVAQSRHFFR